MTPADQLQGQSASDAERHSQRQRDYQIGGQRVCLSNRREDPVTRQCRPNRIETGALKDRVCRHQERGGGDAHGEDRASTVRADRVPGSDEEDRVRDHRHKPLILVTLAHERLRLVDCEPRSQKVPGNEHRQGTAQHRGRTHLSSTDGPTDREDDSEKTREAGGDQRLRHREDVVLRDREHEGHRRRCADDDAERDRVEERLED